MLILKSALFALLILFGTIHTLKAEETMSPWNLVKDEAGIKVYTRTLAHSDYQEFKGIISLETKLDTLLKLINNAERCPDWQYKCIKMLTLSDGYLYKLSDLPWPLTDRYTVMQSQGHFNQTQNSYTLSLKNIARDKLPQAILQQLPAELDSVQMRTSDGYWHFQLNNTGTIHITHQMHGDPAGSLPANLANLGVTNAAYVTLSKLREQ
ncbi:MAG: hypothetical protein K9L22_09110, partial [Methylococcaceae bacterium]|nr:hypothetical protein [Methylococcaceae bacterium]